MGCAQVKCYQIEYRAVGKSILGSTPKPDTKPCNSAANKKAAENTAESQLDTEMDNKREQGNECAKLEKCQCPDWPTPWVGGWQPMLAGLTSVQTVNIGTGCTWTVIVQYDREQRSRTQTCKVPG